MQGFNPLEVPTSYGDKLTVWDYEQASPLLIAYHALRAGQLC